jgi:hypothetical protein
MKAEGGKDDCSAVKLKGFPPSSVRLHPSVIMESEIVS